MDATTVAMCDLEDRIASDYETGFSEQALRQLMKETFLLEMERKRQMGEAILSGGLDSARLEKTGVLRKSAAKIRRFKSEVQQGSIDGMAE